MFGLSRTVPGRMEDSVGTRTYAELLLAAASVTGTITNRVKIINNIITK